MIHAAVESARRSHRRSVFPAALLPALLVACASAPPESLQRDAHVNRLAGGMRCESIVASQEVQLPLQGNLADVRKELGTVFRNRLSTDKTGGC